LAKITKNETFDDFPFFSFFFQYKMKNKIDKKKNKLQIFCPF